MRIALVRVDEGGEQILEHERVVEAYRLANTLLLDEIAALLAEHDIDKSALEAIVVDCGPAESLTGVRIGVATAKGLAYGLGVPLYGRGPDGMFGEGDPAEVLPIYERLSNAEEEELKRQRESGEAGVRAQC